MMEGQISDRGLKKPKTNGCPSRQPKKERIVMNSNSLLLRIRLVALLLAVFFVATESFADVAVTMRWRQNTASSQRLVYVWRPNSSTAWAFDNEIGSSITSGSEDGALLERAAGSHLGVMWGPTTLTYAQVIALGQLLESEIDGAQWYVIPSSAATSPRFEILPSISLGVYDDVCYEEPENTGQFRIARTGSTANALTVYFTRGGSAVYSPSAPDYYFSTAGTGLTASQVTLPVGYSEIYLVVWPYADSAGEGSEDVELTLQTDSAYYIKTPLMSEIIIYDFDP
jgi:hypothetical protein